VSAKDPFEICQAMLPKVSRTFALNISVLRGDLHRSVVIAYLWCRILDTVEDAGRFPVARKVAALRELESIFRRPEVDPRRLATLLDTLGDLDGEPDEIALVQGAAAVAECYNALDAERRRVIHPSLADMARGMATFQEQCDASESLGLADEAGLDRYCYVVAGTVGEMLTSLFVQDAPIEAEGERVLRSLAVSFGLGLQTTNITKDVMLDIERGWCYIPRSVLERAAVDVGAGRPVDPAAMRRAVDLMIPKCLGHLRDALAYICALPRRSRRIRLFCIWPVWLAVRTLRMMARPDFVHRPEVSPKIGRDEVRDVVRSTSLSFWSNRWLRRDFRRMAAEIERNVAARHHHDRPPSAVLI